MKRSHSRISYAVVGLMLALMMAGSIPHARANPSPQADVQGFCSDNEDFGMSHGECVSIAETNVNALAARGNTDGVTICQILENVFGPFPMGQCVSRFAGY
jgi:hypothetical protein